MWGDLLRSLLAWPMWTRRRAATVAAVAVAAIWAASAVHGARSDDGAEAAAAPLTSQATSTTLPTATSGGTSGTPSGTFSGSTGSGEPTSSGATATSVPEPTPTWSLPPETATQVRRAAKDAVTAWARPALKAADWRTGMLPHVTAYFAAQLDTIDPGRIPARKVTGEATVVAATAMEVLADVRTDAGIVHVRIRHERGTWLMDSVWRAQEPPPTATGPQPADE